MQQVTSVRRQLFMQQTKKKADASKKYFKNPLIQTADNMSSGASIEIVLGTDDDIRSNAKPNILTESEVFTWGLK